MRFAVVTGGTRGIGRAVSEHLLEEGYFVIAVYAANEYAAQVFLEENADKRERIALIRSDLSGYEAACVLAQRIKSLCAELDVLVLNSATTDFTPFEEITPENWKRVMDVNLNAPFFLVQKLASVMAPERGRIILLGSHVGKVPHARSISYGVSKAGVHALTKYLVKYFAPNGITVNCIVPGTIETSWHDEKTPEHRRRIEDKIALHRFGTTDEVAELCMAVVHNQYINGACLDIDGGYSYR